MMRIPDKVFESIGTKNSNLVGVSNIYKYIQFSKMEDLYKIYQFLYKDSSIFLDRKKIKYTYIIDNYKNIIDEINLNRRISYKNKKNNEQNLQ
jgi:hypothetical protein